MVALSSQFKIYTLKKLPLNIVNNVGQSYKEYLNIIKVHTLATAGAYLLRHGMGPGATQCANRHQKYI